MFKFRSLKKIRVQIAIFYFITIFITITLIGITLYNSIFNIELNQNLNSIKTEINKSGGYVELYVDRLKGLSNIIVKDSSTVNYLKEKENVDLRQRLSLLINNALESDTSIKSIVIVGKDGRVVSNEQNVDMSMSSDMMKEPWYVDAIKSDNMPVLTKARMQKFAMDKDSWVISLSQEIKDVRGNNLGVLLIDIRYKIIENFLNDLNSKDKGYVFILNDKNEVVYHKDANYFVNPSLQSKLIEQSKMPEGYDLKKKILIQPYRIKNTDWTLIGVSSLYELNAIKMQLMNTILIMSILLVIVATFSGNYFAGKITRPIARLEDSMNDIENGLSFVNISESGCYEAQSLAKHFNNMIEKIKKLLEEISRKEKYLRSFEINALYSQINPHFLYNTLDTIVWMAEFKDTEKVVDMTKALAKFFRLSLNGGSEITTIENELDHIKQYLYIQKERYGDKLNYDISYDASIGDIKILKIILQPIVENAIYHGTREVDRPGFIDISVKRNDEGVIFIIKDNGNGFDVNVLEQDKKKKDIKLGGIGINNVDKRIKLYYGEAYGVSITSIIGVGTTVEISVGEIKTG